MTSTQATWNWAEDHQKAFECMKNPFSISIDKEEIELVIKFNLWSLQK